MTEAAVRKCWGSTALPSTRTREFQRNEALEALLAELQSDLEPAENRLTKSYREKAPAYPIILLMGPLRSGTTLLMQWLANSGLVCYPSNLLARFYFAPIIGAKIQRLLTDRRYNFRDELSDLSRDVEYSSSNGKTQGALAPNEFWYFWRQYLPEWHRDLWTDDELRAGMDFRTMLAELAGVVDVFERPFAAKGMLFNYNIPVLDSIIPEAIFIQMKRDPVANVASVLDARRRQLGDDSAWYSFKVPEYEQLRDLDPVDQAAGQILSINRAVSDGIADVSEERKVQINYEEFCAKPESIFRELTARLGHSENVPYKGPLHFPISRTEKPAKHDLIERALSDLSWVETD